MKNEKDKERLDEKEAANYVYQLCQALTYMHSKDIIHRDIKPENLLIDQGILKVFIKV